MTTADGGDADRGVAPAGVGAPTGDAPAGKPSDEHQHAGTPATAAEAPVAGPGVLAHPATGRPGRGGRRPPPGRLGTALVGVVGIGIGLLLGGVADGDPPAPPPAAAADVSLAPSQPVPTATVTHRPPPRVLRQAAQAPAPTRLVIPALGIDQGFVELGITGSGSLEVPTRPDDIGWWSGGPAPGDPGGAVVAAHVRLGGEPAAFLDLGAMEPGQEVSVVRVDASTATYRVTSVEQFAKDSFPESRVYTSSGPSTLHLITCGGQVDPATGHYLDNVVVFAELMDEDFFPAEGGPADGPPAGEELEQDA